MVNILLKKQFKAFLIYFAKKYFTKTIKVYINYELLVNKIGAF